MMAHSLADLVGIAAKLRAAGSPSADTASAT
jgi:hypothetical protein